MSTTKEVKALLDELRRQLDPELIPYALQIRQQLPTVDFAQRADEIVRCNCGASVVFREGDFAAAAGS